MDSTSRRAFALDSRTVWVEQQIVDQFVLPKDNFVLGPGEYHIQIPERHVSTPSLGKFRGPADHFNPFKSQLSIKTPLSSSKSPTRRHSPNSSRKDPRLDSFSVFQDSEERHGIDPNHRYYQGPGPYLAHDPPLQSLTNSGVNKVHSTVTFGKNDEPFGFRNPVKQALPDYEVNYDSNQIKKGASLGSFPKSKRIYIPKKGDIIASKELDSKEELVRSRSPPANRSISSPNINDSSHEMSVFDLRCSLVKLPKLKTKKPMKLYFDDSSYQKKKLEAPIDLSPSLINKQAHLNLFDHMLTIPRKHKTTKMFKDKLN